MKSAISSIKNSRRLEAHQMGTPECMSKCTGVPELGGAFARMGEEPDGAALLTLCADHKATLLCVGTSTECGPSKAMMPIVCICNCPKVAVLSDGDAGMKQVCADRSGTVGCMKNENTCAMSVESDPTLSDDSMMDLSCKFAEKGCEAKMEACGGEMGGWIADGCDENLKANSAKCCPHGDKLINCMTKECINLQWAVQQKLADKGGTEAMVEMEKNYAIAETCPGTGLPKSKAEVEAATKPKSTAVADFAMSSQSIPVLSMAVAAIGQTLAVNAL